MTAKVMAAPKARSLVIDGQKDGKQLLVENGSKSNLR